MTRNKELKGEVREGEKKGKVEKARRRNDNTMSRDTGKQNTEEERRKVKSTGRKRPDDTAIAIETSVKERKIDNRECNCEQRRENTGKGCKAERKI